MRLAMLVDLFRCFFMTRMLLLLKAGRAPFVTVLLDGISPEPISSSTLVFARHDPGMIAPTTVDCFFLRLVIERGVHPFLVMTL